MRRAAGDATVLLKNAASLLPLSAANKALKGPVKTIAVIGDNSKTAITSGGGSAALRPSWTASPLEAITAAAKEEFGAEVSWAVGAPGRTYQPLIDPFIKDVHIDFYNGPWEGVSNAQVVHATPTSSAFNMFIECVLLARLPLLFSATDPSRCRRRPPPLAATSPSRST